MIGLTVPLLILARRPAAVTLAATATPPPSALTSAAVVAALLGMIVTSLMGYSSAGYTLPATELKLARMAKIASARFAFSLTLLMSYVSCMRHLQSTRIQVLAALPQ